LPLRFRQLSEHEFSIPSSDNLACLPPSPSPITLESSCSHPVPVSSPLVRQFQSHIFLPPVIVRESVDGDYSLPPSDKPTNIPPPLPIPNKTLHPPLIPNPHRPLPYVDAKDPCDEGAQRRYAGCGRDLFRYRRAIYMDR